MKELRLASVTGIEAGNAFLPRFVKRLNECFYVPASKPENLCARNIRTLLSGTNNVTKQWLTWDLSFCYR